MIYICRQRSYTGTLSPRRVLTVITDDMYCGYTQKKPTETWEDSAPCNIMSEILIVIVFKVHLVRDGHVKLVKCPGTQHVSGPLSRNTGNTLVELA